MNELLKDFKFNCQRCFDTGIWLTPTNDVAECPQKVMLPGSHPQLNAAAEILQRSVRRFKERNYVMPQTFDLARILSNYTTDEPCARQLIFDLFWQDTNLTEANRRRKLVAMIEELRLKWLLPIGSRKIEPSGYWIITTLEDFKAWFDRVKSAPITQLSTIHKVAKHNFPLFAEQMEIDFWTDMKKDEVAA
jgi:hypothetical protein